MKPKVVIYVYVFENWDNSFQIWIKLFETFTCMFNVLTSKMLCCSHWAITVVADPDQILNEF